MKLGIYQHFRNKQFYEVIGVARHSETKDELVVYKALYKSDEFGEGQLWVRPKSMFCGNVLYDGEFVPRFAFRKAIECTP